jgi:hypothetical protein
MASSGPFKGIISRDFGVLFMISLDRYDVCIRAADKFLNAIIVISSTKEISFVNHLRHFNAKWMSLWLKKSCQSNFPRCEQLFRARCSFFCLHVYNVYGVFCTSKAFNRVFSKLNDCRKKIYRKLSTHFYWYWYLLSCVSCFISFQSVLSNIFSSATSVPC